MATGWKRNAANGLTILGALVCVLVVSAPQLLSAQDLVSWAGSPAGLGQHGWWRFIAPFALDGVVAVCIGATVAATARRRPGARAHFLLWAFAVLSAYANYRFGITLRAEHRAGSAYWLYPAMSLGGAALVEFVAGFIRAWDDHEDGHAGRYPKFGARWVFAPWTTLLAFRWAVLNMVSGPAADALAGYQLDRRRRQTAAAASPAVDVDEPAAALAMVSPVHAALTLASQPAAADPEMPTWPDTPEGQKRRRAVLWARWQMDQGEAVSGRTIADRFGMAGTWGAAQRRVAETCPAGSGEDYPAETDDLDTDIGDATVE
jgi:hypothetical protein